MGRNFAIPFHLGGCFVHVSVADLCMVMILPRAPLVYIVGPSASHDKAIPEEPSPVYLRSQNLANDQDETVDE